MQHGAGARLPPSARSAPAKAQLSCKVQATNVGSLGGDQEDFLEEVPLQAEDLEQSEGGQGTNTGGNGDFLGGPMAKNLHSQWRGPGFNPSSRN